MKYMGSKEKIAPFILPYIHSLIMINNINLYIEPFIGGANMIDKVQCKKKIGSDINKYLVALLNHVKENIRDLPDDVTHEMFIDAKENINTGKYEDWYIGCIEFLASYNGKGFDGGYGGKYINKDNNEEVLRDYYNEAKKNLINQSNLLKDIDIQCRSYETYSDIKGALIYCDPPYKNTQGYNSSVFNHTKFWDWVREMSKNNIVLVSEEQAPEDFETIWEMKITRTLNNNGRKDIVEKLFMHKSLVNKDEEVDI